MTISEAFAEFATARTPIPHDVLDLAQLALLDLVGVTYAGAQLGVAKAVATHVTTAGGRPEARVLVTQSRVPATQAAFANGVAAHALDMDDGHRMAAAHPAVAVIPAALAGGEREGATGDELLRAIVLGYEVFVRVAIAINPGHLRRGFHTTSTVGPFGAATAVASLMGLDQRTFADALGLAGLSGAGLLEVLRSGAVAKPIQTARASSAGVLAAELAAAGVEGPRSIFEGEAGFLAAMAGDIDRSGLTAGLGSEWAIRGTYFKGYAACRHTHAVIDGALQLREEGLRDAEVRAVRVRTYAVAHGMCGSAGIPRGEQEAKFSIPYTFALALVHGHAGQSGFTPPSLADPRVRELIQKTTVSVDPEFEAAYPDRRGAMVEVDLADSSTRVARVPLARGEPETPFERREIIAKFTGNVSGVLTPQQARDLETRILSIERAGAFDLFGVLQPVSASAP